MGCVLRQLLVYFTLWSTTILCAKDATSSISALSDGYLSLDGLETDGDPDLEEWLQSNIRTPVSLLKPCPLRCSEAEELKGEQSWFQYPDATSFSSCNETMLLSLVVRNNLPEAIRACTADYDLSAEAPNINDAQASLCSTPNHNLELTPVRISTSAKIQRRSTDVTFSPDHMVAAGRQVRSHLASQETSCDRDAISIGYSQSALLAVFSGPEVHQHGLTFEILREFMNDAKTSLSSKTTIVQLCQNNDGLGADYIIGIIATSSSNVDLAQEALRTWSSGKCVEIEDRELMSVTRHVPQRILAANSTSFNNETSVDFHIGSRISSSLTVRAECKTATVPAGAGCWDMADICGISQDTLRKYNSRENFCSTLIQGEKICCTSGTLPPTIPPAKDDGFCETKAIKAGDDCASMASKCGLSGYDFERINKRSNLCSTMAEGQQVCCSYGKLPDRRPSPEADGTCATYKTQEGDGCSAIAALHDLTIADIEEFNGNTWGWNGCTKPLWLHFKLCVSKGNPPMPEPVYNAVCGPTVPNTKRPSKGGDLSKLNPCPLKACCNVWGQCGLSDDFCVEAKSESGAPGTSGVKNGCVSNCGRDIIKGTAPASTINIAYFEAWNEKRPCLTMDVTSIDTTKYSHIHFAFAEVTRDFKVDISKVQAQFDKFKAMSGIKRIISFGGWDFSALPETYSILRDAVRPENRDKFRNNIVSFVKQHGLDGVDLDWEYPGAPDIPDIPADDPQNGLNYYKLLTMVKSDLGDSKSVSFAAPSSYWYLKAYPIQLMAKSLDYIVYMTYDLHGQWDYNNKWTSPGCPTGNCLRSHLNDTETKDALSMITKAGAPSGKVVVGVASYGRSFKMATAGCDGPQCLFTGSPRVSNAAKGRCTDTAGYISNAEIAEIVSSNRVTRQWKDVGSNIMVYDETEWVAYMDDNMKSLRSKFYDMYNFAGTTDWAVDLQAFVDGSGGGDDGYDDDEEEIDTEDFPDCNQSYSTLQSLESDASSIDPRCLEKYIITAEVSVMESAMVKYDDLIKTGYDGKFKIYERYVKDLVPLQVNKFMASDKVHKYFKCVETGDYHCCKDCQNIFCHKDCKDFKGCKPGFGSFPITCPQREFEVPMISGEPNLVLPNATFELTDAEGFWKDIGEEYGVEESWITFGRRHMRTSNGCQYANEDIRNCQEKQDSRWYNYPNADDSKIKVYNPKEIVSKSYDETRDLLERLIITRDVIDWDLIPWSDVVDSASVPALSVQTAVDNMEEIVKKAKEIEKAEKVEFILNMVLGVLFFVPFAGSAAASAGMIAVRNILRLIDVAGQAGMAIYDIVENPSNAFMTIFTTLVGAGLSSSMFKDAAAARRAMSRNELATFGPIKKDLDRIESIRGGICKI